LKKPIIIYYIKTINRTEEVNKKKRNPLTPVGKSCNVAALAGPFNTGWYWGGALAPVA
jgi:hypothetical protein